MERTEIPLIVASNKGVPFTTTAADTVNGNYFRNGGRELLFVDNSGGDEDVTVTVEMAKDQYGRHGVTQTVVKAGQQAIMGLFPPIPYNQPGGHVYVSVSAPCNLAAIRVKSFGII